MGSIRDPGKAPVLKKWARDYWEAIHPVNLDGAYTNFMMHDEGESRLTAAYGSGWMRSLASVRRWPQR